MENIATSTVNLALGIEVSYERDGKNETQTFPIRDPNEFAVIYKQLFDLTIGAAVLRDIKHPLYGCIVKGFSMQVKLIEEVDNGEI